MIDLSSRKVSIKVILKRSQGEKIFELRIDEGTEIKEVLLNLNLNPLAFFIVKNGKVVTENEYVEEGEEYLILPAVSGG